MKGISVTITDFFLNEKGNTLDFLNSGAFLTSFKLWYLILAMQVMPRY